MHLIRTSTFLRWVLFSDAATCIAAGLLMMLGSGLLERQHQLLGLRERRISCHEIGNQRFFAAGFQLRKRPVEPISFL